jgi:hypothetical protein
MLPALSNKTRGQEQKKRHDSGFVQDAVPKPAMKMVYRFTAMLNHWYLTHFLNEVTK